MNEEQAVLDFFAQSENLPLALSVAEQVDATRQQLNRAFWLALCERIAASTPEWKAAATEDRNDEDSLVGLHLEPVHKQTLYLRPMLEQQYLGDVVRIYFGLMWSTVPAPALTRLSAVSTLRNTLQASGFKNNENFLAWQWTPYHPRRRDFLLRFATAPNAVLDEVSALLHSLLVTHADAVHAANLALRDAPRSTAISLTQLRSKL